MTIHLSEDLERFVHDAVSAGLYPSEDDVIRDALTRLKEAMPARKSPPALPPKKPLTEAEIQQHMLDIGLMSQLPDTDADYDDPDDQPIEVEGEPLSEMIIRKHR